MSPLLGQNAMNKVRRHTRRSIVALALLGLAVALSVMLVPTAHSQSGPTGSSLAPGWNVVPWGTGTGIEQPTDPTLGVIWAWDATTQTFQSFNPTLPDAAPPAWSADAPVWVHNSSDNALDWPRTTITAARSVPLVAGWNLELWTGPDAFPIGQAIATLDERAEAVWFWSSAEQRYLVYRPNSTALPSSLAALNQYDGVWLQMREAATWEQPAGADDGDSASLAIAVNAELDHIYIGDLGAASQSVALEIRSAAGAVLFSENIDRAAIEQVAASAALSTASFPLGLLIPPDLHGVDIDPGMTIAVSGGDRAGSVEVDSITVQDFDPGLDAVVITGPPGGLFDLWILRENAGSIAVGYVLGASGQTTLSRDAISAIVGGNVVWLAANSPSSALGAPFSTIAFAGGAAVGPE